MNKFCSIVSLILACLLYGCNSEVDAIRNGRLEAYPEYTVGQAFDNRDMCESTDWATTEDERGRVIIRYTCHMKGIPSLYKKQAESLIAESNIEKPLNSLRKGIKIKQQKINKILGEIKRKKEILKSKDYASEIDKEYKEILECRKSALQSAKEVGRNGGRHVDLTEIGCTEGEKEGNTLSIGHYSTYAYPETAIEILSRKLEKLETLISRKKSSKDYIESEISRLEYKIKEPKHQISVSKQDIKNYEERRNKKIAEANRILAQSEKTDAYETVDWISLEDGTFMIIGGALHEKGPGSNDYKTTEHRKIEYILRSAYRNTPSNFFDYKEAIKKQSFIDVFGRYH